MGDVAVRDNGVLIEKIVTQGDVEKLSPTERAAYYTDVCHSLGLNPLTQPFEFIRLNGKLRMYAKREAAEQLRKLNGISIVDMTTEALEGVYVVRVKGSDKTGRTDMATGAVPIKGLQGEALANAMLKAETKAKRRLTLSISGLGMLDETEVDSIPAANRERVVSANEPAAISDEELAAARKMTLELVARSREMNIIGDEEQHALITEIRDSKSVQVLRARYAALNREIKARETALDAPAEAPSEPAAEEVYDPSADEELY